MIKTMIKALAICSLMLIVSEARAGQRVSEVVGSSYTVTNVSVSSATATQIDAAGTFLPGRTFITIQNMDASYKINCSHSSSVTTSTGFIIPPNGGSITLPIYASSVNGRLTVYCITQNTTASSTVAVIQGY